MGLAKKSSEEHLSFLQFVRHTRSIQKKGHCEMARCERYTGDTERLIENSRRGVALRKTKPVITEGHLLFLLILFLHYQTVSLPTAGLLASARAPSHLLLSSPPTLSSSHRSRSRHRHPLQPPSATMSVVSLSLVLEFRSCSCGNVRTNLNKRQPVVRGIELHGHSNHRWRLPSLKRFRRQRSRFEISLKMDPSLTPAVSSLRRYISIRELNEIQMS